MSACSVFFPVLNAHYLPENWNIFCRGECARSSQSLGFLSAAEDAGFPLKHAPCCGCLLAYDKITCK